MGTLSERLADAVACDGVSADKAFDVRRSSRTALRFIPKKPVKQPVDREGLFASRALGADIVRDVAPASASV